MKKVFVSVILVAALIAVGISPGTAGIDGQGGCALAAETTYTAGGISKKQQSVSGPVTYNVYWKSGTVTLKLANSARTSLSYAIADGADIAELSEDGDRLLVSGTGTVMLRAVAEETDNYYGVSVYIAVSCNDYQPGSGVENSVYTYDRFEHPFNNSVEGAVKCTPLYLNAGNSYLTWSADAPVYAGTYLVRLDMETADNESFVEFATITIKKRKLKIKKLKVATKEWNGTDEAHLTGILDGVIEGDTVFLGFPEARFTNTDAGKNKKVVVHDGSFWLSGESAEQYSLTIPAIKKLKGVIKPKSVTVMADDKTTTEGEPVLALTYSVDGADETDLRNVELSCKVNKNSLAGTYPIKVKSVKGNPNYKIKKICGMYTVLPSPYNSSSGVYGDSSSYGDSDGYGGSGGYSGSGGSGTDGTGGYDYGYGDDSYGGTGADGSDGTGGSGSPSSPSASPKPSYEFKLEPSTLDQVLVFDGLSDINTGFKKKVFTVNYWLTKDAVVKTIDNAVKISTNKKRWQTSLHFNTGAKAADIKKDKGSCLLKKNLTFYAKYKDTICKIVVSRFICDREKPQITLDGIRGVNKRSLVGTGISQSDSFTFNVGSVYGLAGKKTLAYKYVSDSSVIDVGADWNIVKRNQITVDRDFSGCLAIKATDRIGNTTVVYTDTITVDASAPIVAGIENGGEYKGTVAYSVSDLSGVASVSVDGKVVPETGEVHGGGLRTMTAIDAYGNRKDITFRCADTNAFQGLVQSVKSMFGGV